MGIREEEAYLYGKKWFEYRDASPETCDMLFIREWIRARNRFMDFNKFDVNIDRDGNEYVKDLEWVNYSQFKEDAEVMAHFKKCRRFADRHCIEYRRFWSIAFEVLGDIEWRGDISVIAKNLSLRSSIVEIHLQRYDEAVPMSDSPRLKPENYTGTNGQRDYFRYIKEEVTRRYPNSWEKKLAMLSASGRYIEIN